MIFWADKKFMFNFDGKDYGFGDVLPDGISEETLRSLKKKGRISEEAPAAPFVAPSVSEELKGLKLANAGMRAELEAACKEVSARAEEFEAAEKTIAELVAKLEAAEKTIAEFTETATKPKGGK